MRRVGVALMLIGLAMVLYGIITRALQDDARREQACTALGGFIGERYGHSFCLDRDGRILSGYDQLTDGGSGR